jgi:hypothetical protein
MYYIDACNIDLSNGINQVIMEAQKLMHIHKTETWDFP